MPPEPSQTESSNRPAAARIDPWRLPKRFLAAAALIGLLWIPAATIQGADPLRPDCPADPAPKDAAAAQWFPGDPLFAERAGRELLARPDYPAALCYLEKAAAGLSGDASFLLDLGDAHWGAGNKPAALTVWEQGRQADPTSDGLLERLRMGYLDGRQWENAAGALAAWLARHGDDADARYRLGLIRAALDPGSALDLLEELHTAPAPLGQNADSLLAVIRAADPFQDAAYLFARTGEELIRLGEPELALEALSRAIAQNPRYGDAYSLRGLAQESTGADPGESYRLGAQYAPDSAVACWLYGSWLAKQGDPALARWWLARAWEKKPGDWRVASALADAEFAAGNLGAAEEWLRQAVESDPQDPDAWIALGSFYIGNDLRVAESGIPAARQAVLLAPENGRALDLLGLGWFTAGDLSEADRFFRKALEINPDSSAAHLHLARLLLEEGKVEEAVRELDTVRNLDPNGENGAQAEVLLSGMRGSG
jgi:tetratricopeptide (TPR) repeat protein